MYSAEWGDNKLTAIGDVYIESLIMAMSCDELVYGTYSDFQK